MTDILEVARGLVTNDREARYGHPAVNFARTAQMWSVILGVSVTPAQVGLCMIALKIAREIHAHTPDNLVDIAGYAHAVARVYEQEELCQSASS